MMKNFRTGKWGAVLTALILGWAVPGMTQQVDTTYVPPIDAPTYATGSGPTVVIDAAHLNFHTADAGYTPFATLLRRDGYVVTSNHDPFTTATLDRADILVVVNAMHEESEAHWGPLPNHSAFTDAEITQVEKWVHKGGALLLIADHMPLAGHAEALAAAFGVRFHNGFAFDATGNGQITFRRSDGSLPESVIANGRSPGERVDSVTTFTGQAFRLDPAIQAEPLLVLPDRYTVLLPEVAFKFTESTPRIPGANLLQGAIVYHGQGRVAVFGEAAMFSAQLGGPDKRPVGMNAETASDNYRFALNLLHWLSGDA